MLFPKSILVRMLVKRIFETTRLKRYVIIVRGKRCASFATECAFEVVHLQTRGKHQQLYVSRDTYDPGEKETGK